MTMLIHPWASPPATRPPLAQRTVHLWRASCEIPSARIAALRAQLSPEECAKVDRFYFARDRERSTISYALLRRLVASYTGAAPEQVRYSTGTYGKPALAAPEGSPLCFNVSHSGSQIYYAFTLGRELGVDVEQERDNIGYEQLADHSFSPVERQALLALPPAQRKRAFFACWTRKEAYIKARGEGLSHGLDRFDVTLDDPARLLATRDDPRNVERWSLHAIAAPPGYQAALCVQGGVDEVCCWECGALFG